MLSKLTAIIGDAEHSIDLLSAYFIPGDAGTDILTAAAQSGVRVHPDQFAGSDRRLARSYRLHKIPRPLLDAGVEVYEMRKAPVRRAAPSWAFLAVRPPVCTPRPSCWTLIGSLSVSFDPARLFSTAKWGSWCTARRWPTHDPKI